MTQLLTDPKNRGEQIQGVTRFVLENDQYYDSLRHTPNRLNACALNLFLSNNCSGYHANVVRKALQELEQTGMIDHSAPPYETTQE